MDPGLAVRPTRKLFHRKRSSMTRSSIKSERITMVLSTLVAAAILGAAVTAQHGLPATHSELARLESDLRLQLDFAFRHNTDEHDQRAGQLNSVIDAWLNSPQSAEDEQLLAEWLRVSIRQSMPGSNQPLPDAPQFGVLETIQIVEMPEDVAVDEIAAEAWPAEDPTALPAPPEVAEIAAQPRDARLPLAVSSYPSRRLVVAQPDATLLSASIPPHPQPAEVYVNLAELSARIAGYHDGLDEVEAALFHLPEQNRAAAEQSLSELRQLAGIYRFVKMYYDTLTEDERWAVSSPRSPVAVCQQFSDCLDELATSSDDDFLRPYDASASAKGDLGFRKLREGLLAVLDHVED